LRATSVHFQVGEALLAAASTFLSRTDRHHVSEASRLIAIAEHGRFCSRAILNASSAVIATAPILTIPCSRGAPPSIFSPRPSTSSGLDLMVHDLDIVLSFVQSPVHSLHALACRSSPARSTIATSASNSSLAALPISPQPRQHGESPQAAFLPAHQYVSIDYAGRICSSSTFTSRARRSSRDAAAAAPQALRIPGLNIEKPEVRPGEPLRLEIESFLDCVRTRPRPAFQAKWASRSGARARRHRRDCRACGARRLERTCTHRKPLSS